MRVLLFGVTGMLGHQLFKYFSKDTRFETFGVVRSTLDRQLFPNQSSYDLPILNDIWNTENISKILDECKPSVLINCIGAVKQAKHLKTLDFININSVFPHLLNDLTSARNIRLIHFSTDCVFGEGPGTYFESDAPICQDVYGRSKVLGEITNCDLSMTIRTSIVGRELKNKYGLLEWFLKSDETVKGYTNAHFTGLSTFQVSEVTRKIILSEPTCSGLYHLAAERISKYDLLVLMNDHFSLKKNVVASTLDTRVDRSLDGSRLASLINLPKLTWNEMVKTL